MNKEEQLQIIEYQYQKAIQNKPNYHASFFPFEQVNQEGQEFLLSFLYLDLEHIYGFIVPIFGNDNFNQQMLHLNCFKLFDYDNFFKEKYIIKYFNNATKNPYLIDYLDYFDNLVATNFIYASKTSDPSLFIHEKIENLVNFYIENEGLKEIFNQRLIEFEKKQLEHNITQKYDLVKNHKI
jgi:hypothetical protein